MCEISQYKYINECKYFAARVILKKIFRKILNQITESGDRLFSNIFGAEITDEKFLKNTWSSKYKFKDSKELKEYFCNREKPKFIIKLLYEGNIISFFPKICPDILNEIIAYADKICEHTFDLFGTGKICLGAKIKWHCDFKTGYCWNFKKYYKDIEIPYGKADIKVPWELSRFQHLTTLGEAYFLSKDEKYVEEFVNQVADWIEHNPPKFGVNWKCTMDVAIRACNWLLAWEFFRSSPSISNEFIIKFFKSLLQHGRHIKNNLEWSETLTSNHYLSDIVGLVYLGVLIPEFKESKKWKNFGIKELKKEMKKQVYPDGVDFEASTCYHRLVLELFFYATLLVIINDKNSKGDNLMEVGNEIFGEKYIQRLYKMFEFILYALKPDGRMPQIGDNDNGRLHIFAKREVLDMRYLLTLGAIFFKEPKFKVKEFGFCEEGLWIFGKESYKIWQDLEENRLANIGSQAFPDAGWYIMRSNKDYMIISCGPNGQNGNGGHCHNDKLSFELCVDEQDVIVDPGTYVYTPDPEARNRFRGTVYHNTVMIDGEEQNRSDKHSVFWMNNDAFPKCLKWKAGNEVDVFVGEHYGYKRFTQSVIHKREIRYYKKDKKWEIIDKFRGEGEYNLEWNLILSPEFKQELKISSDKLQWHREPAFYSSEYGTIAKTKKLSSTLRATVPVKVKFWIEILK